MRVAPPETLTLALALAGCLSGGPPPAGRKVAEGRDPYVQMAFLTTPSVTGLLVLRRDIATPPADLHLFTISAEGAVADRVLAQSVAQGPFPPAVDARGRLVVQIAPAGMDPNLPFSSDLQLIDPGTGDRVDLGPVADFRLSPGGTRLWYDGGPAGSELRLRELDDREVTLGSLDEIVTAGFVGEDLYYATKSDSRLWRVRAAGDPEPIADQVTGVQAYGDTVVLSSSLDPTSPVLSVLDTSTLERTALPGVSYISSFSPDGRWILANHFPSRGATDPNDQAATMLVERATGSVVQIIDAASTGSGEWRSGRDELWYADYSGTGMTIVVTPWGRATLDRLAVTHYRGNDLANTYFALDGQLFFSIGSDESPVLDRAPVEIGPVDDPNGRFTRLNPAGSGLGSFWELADGRLLAENWYKDPQRADLTVVDPAPGASRIIGEAGGGIAVGLHRVLAKLRLAKNAGDLVLIDPDTGAQTKLAESVTEVVVERRAGGDALAPGTRVAFSVVNPIASPYDGIWVAVLP